MNGFAEKCQELYLMACVKIYMAKEKVKQEATELANSEMGVSGIVVSLILIGIAIALAVIFRDSIAKFMKNIFENIFDPNETPDPNKGY